VIVGSLRTSSPDNVRSAAELRSLCEATSGVTLLEGYADDERFDAWIAAADRVVLPYTRSWSSGALARAHALGTPAIVSDVGGLREQASAADTVVTDDEELVSAMRTVLRQSSERVEAGR
jgi:glycosyltransferase involved in cell wall biosynthesis